MAEEIAKMLNIVLAELTHMSIDNGNNQQSNLISIVAEMCQELDP